MSAPGDWQLPDAEDFDNMPAAEGEDNDGPSTTNDTSHPNEDGHANEDHADASAPPDRLSIVISDARGGSLTFMVKPHMKLKKAMEAYAQRTSLDRATLRFFLDGERVLDDSTPASLAMEEGDIIEAYTEQIGGSSSTNNGTMPNEAHTGKTESKNPVRSRRITFTICDPHGHSVCFKAKPTAKLRKVMDAYTDRETHEDHLSHIFPDHYSRERQSLRFVFAGKQVRDEDTLASLEMKDEDIIYAFRRRGPPGSFGSRYTMAVGG